MTIDQINTGYALTLFISTAAVVSGVYVLSMGSKKGKHFFADRLWAYLALNASVVINCFFIYNILLWLSANYVEIKDTEFHIRWLAYHTVEKIAIFMFHHDLYKRVRKWRDGNASPR